VSNIPADSRAEGSARRPRKWRNRQPSAKRLDLAPEDAEAADQERREGQARAFVSVRMTEAEKAKIAKRASGYGMGLSEFVRTVVLSDVKEPPPPKTDAEAVRKLAFELSKLGTNLNQLAHRANEAAKISAETKVRAMYRMEGDLSALAAQIAGALEKVIGL
jgi:hypothetical protein